MAIEKPVSGAGRVLTTKWITVHGVKTRVYVEKDQNIEPMVQRAIQTDARCYVTGQRRLGASSVASSELTNRKQGMRPV